MRTKFPEFHTYDLPTIEDRIGRLLGEVNSLERDFGLSTTNIGRTTMNYSTAVFLINDKVRAVHCNIDPDRPEKVLTFKTFDDKIKVDDFVVVPIKNFHKMAVVKVTEVDVGIDFNSSELVDWIIGTVDTQAFDDLTKQEDAAIAAVKSAEATKKRDELRATLMSAHADKLNKLKLAVPLALSKPKAK